jgi:hypothetical protein
MATEADELNLQARVNAAAAVVKLRGADHRVLSKGARDSLAEARRVVAYGLQRGIEPQPEEVAMLVLRRGRGHRDCGGHPVR